MEGELLLFQPSTPPDEMAYFYLREILFMSLAQKYSYFDTCNRLNRSR
jgi:hypothetical protein